MSERRLPIYVRWTLAAEGLVEDPTFARPRCPVAGWMAHVRPELLPAEPDPERLAAVRIRTDLADELLLQVCRAAESTGRELTIWSLGSGFDARWARLAGPLSPTVTRWIEVDDPRVMAIKQVSLLDSPFRRLWERVESVPMVPAGWDVTAEPGEWPVVLLLGLLHRVSPNGLRTVLARIRAHAPTASVILDLTGVRGRARLGWSARHLRTLGWQVVDDVELGERDVLFDPEGDEVAAGSVRVRMLHLVAAGSEPG